MRLVPARGPDTVYTLGKVGDLEMSNATASQGPRRLPVKLLTVSLTARVG